MTRAPHRLRRLASAGAILVLTAALSACDQGAEQTAGGPAGEPAAPEARDFHGEQQVARRDPGAAHRNESVRVSAAEQLF